MASYTEEELRCIYDRTNGRCHITHKNLRFESYAKGDEDDGWEVDHSLARARGGTDHLNNLYPILISVNRAKQARSAHAMRAQHGTKGPPLSRNQVEARNEKLAVVAAGGVAFVSLGFLGGVVLLKWAKNRHRAATRQPAAPPEVSSERAITAYIAQHPELF